MKYQPEYPAVLTKANWDREKGFFAKVAGFTGMGDSLFKLKAAYDIVRWDKFEFETMFRGGGDFSPNFDARKLENVTTSALHEMRHGVVLQLYNRAGDTRKLADEVGGKFKNNRTIPASSVALCSKISTAAALLQKQVSDGLANHINDEKQRTLENEIYVYVRILKRMHATVRALEVKLDELARDPTRRRWVALDMRKGLRDLSAPITTIELLTRKGFQHGLDPAPCRRTLEEMREIGPLWGEIDPFTGAEHEKEEKLSKAIDLANRLLGEARDLADSAARMADPPPVPPTRPRA